jgi:hypothetical protein
LIRKPFILLIIIIACPLNLGIRHMHFNLLNLPMLPACSCVGNLSKLVRTRTEAGHGRIGVRLPFEVQAHEEWV